VVICIYAVTSENGHDNFLFTAKLHKIQHLSNALGEFLFVFAQKAIQQVAPGQSNITRNFVAGLIVKEAFTLCYKTQVTKVSLYTFTCSKSVVA